LVVGGAPVGGGARRKRGAVRILRFTGDELVFVARVYRHSSSYVVRIPSIFGSQMGIEGKEVEVTIRVLENRGDKK